MSADGGNPGWVEAAVAFIAACLPREAKGEWRDYASTAFQLGCGAMVALGQAEARSWGAVPLPSPSLPDILPRWDDICFAVLWLAEQQGGLEHRLADGIGQRLGDQR